MAPYLKGIMNEKYFQLFLTCTQVHVGNFRYLTVGACFFLSQMCLKADAKLIVPSEEYFGPLLSNQFPTQTRIFS